MINTKVRNYQNIICSTAFFLATKYQNKKTNNYQLVNSPRMHMNVLTLRKVKRVKANGAQK